MLDPVEQRSITASVRARGSDRILWSEAFDTKSEKKVQRLIKRVHGLIDGTVEFKSVSQAYKCRPCGFSTPAKTGVALKAVYAMSENINELVWMDGKSAVSE